MECTVISITMWSPVAASRIGHAIKGHVARRDFVQEKAAPTWILSQSSSVMPAAQSMSRAAGFDGPLATSKLGGFLGLCVGFSAVT